MAEKTLKITWIKSTINCSQRQKNTVKALGLRRLGQSVEHTDSPAVRGMIHKVAHLVQVEE